jgi:hypothetical protein
MDPELVKAITYAQKVLSATLDVLEAALKRDEPTELNHNAPDRGTVGLRILCQSISNFRAAILLVQLDQALEAKVLVPLLYENLLWQAALLEHGSEFVADIREDELFNRRILCELAVKFGKDVNAPGGIGPQGN